MGMQTHVEEIINSFVGIGRIVNSTVKELRKSVFVHLIGDEASGGDEQNDDTELWGDAPMLYRPADPDADGVGMECFFFRWGDDREVFATKDRRWQVVLEKGEVCIRALGPAPAARVWLKPDGSVIVEGASIKLGSASATDFVALASKVETQLNRIKTAISGAATSAGDGGATFKAAIISALNTPPVFPASVGASKVVGE